jgi:hypothetical protein
MKSTSFAGKNFFFYCCFVKIGKKTDLKFDFIFKLNANKKKRQTRPDCCLQCFRRIEREKKKKKEIDIYKESQ